MTTSSGARSAFLDDEGRPQLVRCAVLFLDILGVSELALDASHNAQNLIDLDRVVRRTFHDFLADDSPWPSALLSDSMVVASATGSRFDDAWVLNELLVQTAILQLGLAASGFFARGALTIGDLHIHDGVVFGPALVNSYELERERANNPRVVLSEEATAILKTDLGDYSNAQDSTQGGFLLVDQDGTAFIDYLVIVLDELDRDAGLRIHRDVVEGKLLEHTNDSRKWQKYRWVAEYHNQFCEQGEELKPYAIPALAITPRFDEFK